MRVGMNPTNNINNSLTIINIIVCDNQHTTLNLISTVGTTEIKASLKKTTLVDLMKEEAPSEREG
ncbi:hypothetical protein [Methanobacterium sp. SMA-27]|uniref:hypothetical protein n=1 Tax=Methanobacterium sp. SMA-27 TaxID=1495336 RepID=UPI0012E04D26|nr:hypothetical protein [Methanobacterium sp. SMA-27]